MSSFKFVKFLYQRVWLEGVVQTPAGLCTAGCATCTPTVPSSWRSTWEARGTSSSASASTCPSPPSPSPLRTQVPWKAQSVRSRFFLLHIFLSEASRQGLQLGLVGEDARQKQRGERGQKKTQLMVGFCVC